MSKKNLLYSTIIIAIVALFFLIIMSFDNNKYKSESWVGNYLFFEFAPPNQNMNYIINIYEDNGLYARVTIDGFSTMQRLTAKVWSHSDEIRFNFYDYYVDENGNSSIPEKYDEGDPLLEMKKEDGVIITKWMLIQPLVIENQKVGQYFTKDE